MIDSNTIGVFTTNPTTSTPGVFLVNGVAVGAQYIARVGSKIRMTSVYIRGTIFHASISPLAQTMRLILVYDMQSNGTTITGQNVMLYGTSGPNVDVNSMMNMAVRDRFKIIWDKAFSLKMLGGTTAGDTERLHVNKYKRLNHEVTFSGVDATAGSISTGALWLICLGEISVATDSEANFVGMVRVRFVDC